jgi:hypothetical protein
MPNTPCIVREGMTAICPGSHATEDHLALVRRIFDCVGRCVQTDETHFNAITALSGSGPAYYYLIMEAMADAGVRVGLSRELALTTGDADGTRIGAHGAVCGSTSRRASRRCDDAGGLHDRRSADDGGRQDPLGDRPRRLKRRRGLPPGSARTKSDKRSY